MTNINNYNYFYVCGFMRSGTNWVSNILNLHPEIFVDGEFHFNHLRKSFDRIVNDMWWSILHQEPLKTETEKYFEEFVKKTMVKNAENKDKLTSKWLGDRTPKNITPIILKNAPSFLVIRDGRDILVSWTFHILREGINEQVEDMPEMLEKVEKFKEDKEYFLKNKEQLLDCEAWIRKVASRWHKRTLRDYRDLKRAKANELATKIYHLHYEDLHKDVETERKKMYEFLGLKASKAKPLDSGEVQTKAGFDKEDPNKFYRKGQPGDWANYFNAETKIWFKEEAQTALEAAGYENKSDW